MVTTAAEMVRTALERIEVVAPESVAADVVSGAVVVLDVREPVEWEHHIAGAVQVPRGLLEFAADPASPRHDRRLAPSGRIVVYCNSGGRAALAASTLLDLGFTDVASIAGGFTGWKKAGLPTVEHHADL